MHGGPALRRNSEPFAPAAGVATLEQHDAFGVLSAMGQNAGDRHEQPVALPGRRRRAKVFLDRSCERRILFRVGPASSPPDSHCFMSKTPVAFLSAWQCGACRDIHAGGRSGLLFGGSKSGRKNTRAERLGRFQRIWRRYVFRSLIGARSQPMKNKRGFMGDRCL